MGDIEKAVSFMEAIAKDDSHGYAQDNRGGTPDYDCSSLVGTALNKAGFIVNPLSTTRTLYDQLIKCGFQSIGITDPRLRGDIFLSPGHHVVMCIDANNIVHASINEKNTTTNGMPGDQTGKEICTRNFYTPSYGWTYHLRYPQASTSTSNKAVDISKYNTITNYKTMASQIKNVFIRIAYRSYEKGIITEDTSFKTHIDNCLANGMNVGIYFYDQSINEAEAIEQADWTINRIKDYNITLPIYIDSEYSNKQHNGRADGISKEQRTKNVLAFCNRLIEKGYKNVGVYGSDSWFKSMLIFDQIKHLSIWCARYSTQKPTISKYDIWQYGSEYYPWATNIIDTNIIYNLKVDAKPTTTTQIKSSTTNKPASTSQSSGLTTEKPILLMGKVDVKEGTLNVRTLPTTDAPIVTQIQKGTYIQLRGDLGTWYRMDMGYVSKQYVKEAHGVVIADKLNLRSTPDKTNNNNIITTIPNNTEVIICTAGNGWYCILLDNGQTGWVSGMYIRLK